MSQFAPSSNENGANLLQPQNVERVKAGDLAQHRSALKRLDKNLIILPADRIKSYRFNEASKRFQFWFYQKPFSLLWRELNDACRELSFEKAGEHIEFLDDVYKICCWVRDLTERENLFVSLRTIGAEYFEGNQDSVSQCFHRDSSVFTAFRTYAGFGTQYVSDSNVNRLSFEESPIQPYKRDLSEFLNRPDEIYEVDCNHIGLLKGEIAPQALTKDQKAFLSHFIELDKLEEFNVGRGLIHRGPPFKVNDPLRIVLTVSSFSVPMFMRNLR